MSSALHRTTKQFSPSVNTPDYPVIDWIINPDVSAVAGQPTKYWIITGDVVTLMDQAARDAVDAAEAAALTQSYRDTADGLPDAPDRIDVRALIELFNKRDNYLVNRISELQSALDAIKASTGGTANIRAAIPASWLATSTRNRAAAVADYKADIASGNAD